ncbi:tRNA 2-thiocytidine biosynthesis protein TtcA [Chlamydia psittaci]|uniref:tRNA 2-thiocytidine biosynthesis TtcA family protein n=1 Tax=Chlamydia psittaci TaxID=83554 RepID=UPI0018676B60|nr:tRNA 2-thiocytidine biosynthesis TtcA family protein [Chlamydia psittaci]MBE3635638.1 tRNA 2-thiocytidine biosynthesis protein TtcA [Chlamydia psittaci]BEU44198.1 tRNA 2-thiocytidine biosynthesis TtcA family protein [Chlamydia psittaci]
MSILHLHPPWTKSGKRIESLVRKALYTYSMLENHAKIVIALSGGKDSLSLLLMLKAISGRGFPKLDLYAVNIGGKYSCGSEVSKQYLANICDKIHVPYSSITSPYDPEVPECYSCSQVRRRLLFQAAKDVGATAVAFGHHRDDVVQTALMNLLHKAEFSGMLPVLDMVHFGITILRPLILTPESWIRKFAKESGFSRVTCRCPVVSLRTKTEEALKLLEDVFPQARHNIALAIEQHGLSKAQKNKTN